MYYKYYYILHTILGEIWKLKNIPQKRTHITYDVDCQAMDPSAPEYQYPGQTQPSAHQPQLSGARAASGQKQVRDVININERSD